MRPRGAQRRVEAPAAPPSVLAASGTRGRILEAAIAQFAERGYHATSMRDLAREIGFQPGAIYVHFPSKEHVLAELVRAGHELHYRRLRSALLASGADPVAQIRAVVRAHVLFHAEHRSLAVVIQDEMHAVSPALGGAANELRRQSVSLIEEIVERGLAQGVFSGVHPFVATAAIGAMGMRVAHWLEPDFALSAAQVADTHADMAVRLLGGGT